ncbi:MULTISPECIES: PLP-dependent aminotransferase family protein [unclassified Microbacterium]|uniref:MocR-like pyridoxine biosynthesis transcription factor PdxR n=1 Tax=unclassified Microbacterium TaxID=2609290 RepID=UPI00214CC163|nr:MULTISPECIES: PLP-dependent aminotransferase family protein [unclassified Microbacterium]MCR2783639.1 PLP-dependent aminotransferase family protein [Microbacterium sp. zg.B96]WIM15503.1 PLP-dependent aminotransferase family protein [Microbacterium sp. zg-B96]
MTVDWARGGPDLLVVLESGAAPLGVQIQDQLRAAIRDRRLAAGERLPSTRRLAELLGISRGTIVDAYEQLVAEGYLEAAVGSGTRVAAIPDGGPTRHSRHSRPASASHAPRSAEVDFEYGIPDLRSVPLTDWSWAVSEATRTLPTAGLGDEVPAGSRHLREVVTAYHRRVRSGCAVTEDAVIVSGFRQGLVFALATLARHGIQRIALEDPGPREHDVIARRAGLDAVPVPVDDHGIDVDRLRRTGARAVLVTPAHQCPTGVALGPSRRRELSAWADEVDGVILEDDYDAEFRYDRQPVGSLQGLNPHRVIALGSVSKTFAPAIRLGWVLTPRRFVSGIVEEKRLSSRGAPGLDQEALALLMETGRFDRHLRRMRETYRARRDVLATEAELAFGPGQLHGLAAGCHALLRLPDGTSERAVVSTAATMGVRVSGLASYRFVPVNSEAESDLLPTDFPPSLVLGFGNVDEHQISRGIRTLAEAVHHHRTVLSGLARPPRTPAPRAR